MAWLTDKWASPEECLSNCTDDFSWEIEGMPAYVGHEGMSRRLREMQQQGICGPGLRTRHCVTSVEVMSQGQADKARRGLSLS
jgi:hypothetical protein